jgi:sugar phosphate permease
MTVWSLLLFSRVLFGIFSAPVFPACGRLTGNWFPPSKFGLVQGCVGGASAIGASAAPILFASLISMYGWVWSFCAAGAMTLLFFASWAKRVRDYPAHVSLPPPRPPSDRRHGEFIAILHNRRILLLAVSYASLGYLYGMFDYWIYYYLRDVRHMGQESSALFSSLAQATQLVSIPLGGCASDALSARHRLGRMWFAVTAFIFSAVLLFLGTTSAEAMSTVVLFCVAFGFAASVDSTYFATAIEIAREGAGSAYGIVNAGGSLGSFAAPIVLPMLAVRFGWAAGLSSASLVIAVGVFTWLFIGKSTRVNLRNGVAVP